MAGGARWILDPATRGPVPEPDFLLAYGPGPERVAEVRLPEGTGPAPLVLVLHGGYWRAKHDRGYLGPLCAELTARGYLTANVEYHRSGQPDGGWPGTAEDVRAAVHVLPALIEEAAPGRTGAGTVLLGHSAGGHLALLAAHEGITGILALAAVSDLAETARQRLDEGAAQEFMGGEPAQLPEAYAAADPLRQGPPGARTVLVHGDADDRVPHAFSARYAERFGVHLRTVPGADHFDLVAPGSPGFAAVVEALAEVTG
ncbi:alpha/beta hydrolase family protein [Sciscionella marina]|uniref:alpha/beta hydrolase family protein n=1 Tax=Sciscionella marina TaxID=508770 RepID=UPI000376F312|nr:alpha/beta hydrolase [Sciscionella marina]